MSTLLGRAQDSDALLARLAELSAAITRETRTGGDRFPEGVIARLRACGALAAPLPVEKGGLGWGTTPSGMMPLAQALQTIGAASLAAGRIWEAHVNALALVDLFGSAGMRARVAADVGGGHLFALWVAPGREPVRLSHTGMALALHGEKPVCTAAGIATRAVITVADAQGDEQLVLVDATRLRVQTERPSGLGGMRNTATRPVIFDLTIAEADLLGAPGDYLREPDFSAGAWRTSAVTAGGCRRWWTRPSASSACAAATPARSRAPASASC